MTGAPTTEAYVGSGLVLVIVGTVIMVVLRLRSRKTTTPPV